MFLKRTRMSPGCEGLPGPALIPQARWMRGSPKKQLKGMALPVLGTLRPVSAPFFLPQVIQ